MKSESENYKSAGTRNEWQRRDGLALNLIDLKRGASFVYQSLDYKWFHPAIR